VFSAYSTLCVDGMLTKLYFHAVFCLTLLGTILKECYTVGGSRFLNGHFTINDFALILQLCVCVCACRLLFIYDYGVEDLVNITSQLSAIQVECSMF